jgi:acetyl-CoA carboxylase biotin carboxylase subunit
VTELVTGLDLVRWQLRIAAGEPLTVRQEDVRWSGHAIEFRVYAEDPDTGLPSPGTIDAARFPSGEGIRIDSAVCDGSTLSMNYDPMIAKVLVHRATRDEAIALAGQVLGAVEISGVKTNLPLLRRILASEDFRAGAYHTGSLAELQRTPAK